MNGVWNPASSLHVVFGRCKSEQNNNNKKTNSATSLTPRTIFAPSTCRQNVSRDFLLLIQLTGTVRMSPVPVRRAGWTGPRWRSVTSLYTFDSRWFSSFPLAFLEVCASMGSRGGVKCDTLFAFRHAAEYLYCTWAHTDSTGNWRNKCQHPDCVRTQSGVLFFLKVRIVVNAPRFGSGVWELQQVRAGGSSWQRTCPMEKTTIVLTSEYNPKENVKKKKHF